MQYWVIPPDKDAEFVASMEALLETYAQPYTAERPVVCMDEQPVGARNLVDADSDGGASAAGGG